MNDFATNLRKQRKKEGLNQSDLARLLNISQSIISCYELGTVQPTAENLIEIANYFQITTDELLGLEPIQNKKEELTPSERELLEMYRVLSVEGKGQAQALVKSVKEYETAQRRKSGVKLG